MFNNYQSTLDYLYSFVDYSLTRDLRYSPEKFNLKRMRTFLELIDNPDYDYPIIHVAGTKGKGSICAFLNSVLHSANLKVGLYTSPHMHVFTERIRVNGKNISKAEFVNLIEEMNPSIIKVKGLSTFEITTAAAFLYFSKLKIDIAVIEVGLGGRLDATNVVKPIISVISSISKDHVKILGNTYEKIATEKSGIIKKNIPVVVAPQKPRVLKKIIEIAKNQNSPVYVIDELYRYRLSHHNLRGQIFELFSMKNSSIKYKLKIPLLGFHQIQNAVTAYAVVEIMKQHRFDISLLAVKRGFKKVKWPGRFEVLSEKPFIIIDSAHNLDSVKKLIKTIDEYLDDNIKIILLFGVSEDKDVSGMIQVFRSRVERIIASKSVHPRALGATEIIEIAKKRGIKGEAIIPIKSALRKAIHYWDENSVIIATGSVFVAAAVKEVWNDQKDHNRKSR